MTCCAAADGGQVCISASHVSVLECGGLFVPTLDESL